MSSVPPSCQADMPRMLLLLRLLLRVLLTTTHLDLPRRHLLGVVGLVLVETLFCLLQKRLRRAEQLVIDGRREVARKRRNAREGRVGGSWEARVREEKTKQRPRSVSCYLGSSTLNPARWPRQLRRVCARVVAVQGLGFRVRSVSVRAWSGSGLSCSI